MGNFIIFVIIAVLLYQCVNGDECSSFSKFSCKEIRNANYIVWFSFPDDDKTYSLGNANSLEVCKAVAYSYAESKNLLDTTNWDYICCMVAEGSNCLEKHRYGDVPEK